jgi:hypothetical protein
MTKRHFNLIATIIRDLPFPPKTIRAVAWAFAKGLKGTNPAFNAERFIPACEKPND